MIAQCRYFCRTTYNCKEQVLAFLTELGPMRIISVTRDECDVVIYYWDHQETVEV